MAQDDFIDYKIFIDAVAAIERLRELAQSATTFKQRLDLAAASVKEFNAKTGYGIRNTANAFKSLDESIARATKTSTIFGNESKAGWDRAATGADRAVRGIDAVRIALGAVVAMIIFTVQQAIFNFFSGAIEQAKQFEATLYRIANAEKQLSEAGVDVSIKGLKEGINDLKKAFPIFSKEDIAELIGGIATTTKELGLSEEQMLKLGAAVAVLNINSTEAETLLQTMGKVVNSVISPQAKSVGNLGLAFGKAKIEAKAFEMQILQTGESFADLTEREKTEIKYQIVLETAGVEGVEDLEDLRDMIKEAGGDFAALDEYLQSNAAKLDANAAAWKDLQTTVGQLIVPFIPALTEFFRVINDGFSAAKVIIIEVSTLLAALYTAWSVALAGGDFTETFKMSMEKFREALVNTFFKEIPDDAPAWFMQGWGKHIKEQAETATGPLEDLGEAIEEVDFEDFKNKIEDIIEDTANAREDLARNLDRKLADLDEEYRRKAIDAEVDYRRKVEDINRDAEDDIRDIKEKQRQEDIRDEEKYQLALWELRMRFLMDLEDALHARDARQVLRLQRQYALDKEALAKKHALDTKTREEDQKAELKAAEDKKRQRLEDAKREYEEKLADQRIAKQRELEDLNVWYAREQADIETAQQRKMESLIKGWIDEKKITADNAAEVYGILHSYFGPGGMTDELYKYMAQSLAANTVNAINGVMSQLTGIKGGGIGGGGQTQAITSSGLNLINQGVPPSVAQNLNFADGGTLLATRPTAAIFGEGGPELVNFTPLSRVGKNVGKMFGDASGGGGVNGTIRVAVDLSPDLTGRIVEQSMDGVAEILSQVNRSKV